MKAAAERRVAFIQSAHRHLVFERRIRVLAEELAELIPEEARVLDVGCGDGRLDRLLLDRRPDLELSGIDILVRPDAQIPVEAFDGDRIPRDDNSVDAVLLVDVLHHTHDPASLLAEAARVARSCVVIKDHTVEGWLARPTLRFMDWVGNASHGVALPYNYWSLDQWSSAFGRLGLTPSVFRRRLGLYPAPAKWLFERSLHFVTRLDVGGVASNEGATRGPS